MRKQWKNFSPVLGLAWAPSQNGKTVVRAGAGFFYGPLGLTTSMDAERVALGPPGLGRQTYPGASIPNSLAGVLNGVRQIECTINGLGERAGNTSLEEVVMAVKTRRDVFGLEVCIDATQIVPTSKLVSNITGFPVQPNKENP